MRRNARKTLTTPYGSVGVIPLVKARGETMIGDTPFGMKNQCHYQKLDDFIHVQKPITAAEIKKILGRNVVFLRTMAGMPDGQKLLNALKETTLIKQ
jgi:hypothetical protein